MTLLVSSSFSSFTAPTFSGYLISLRFRLTSRRVCQNIKLVAALCHDRELIICSLFSMQCPLENGTYRIAKGWVCFGSGFSGRAQSSWRCTSLQEPPTWSNELVNQALANDFTRAEASDIRGPHVPYIHVSFGVHAKDGSFGIRGVCVSKRRHVPVAFRASVFFTDQHNTYRLPSRLASCIALQASLVLQHSRCASLRNHAAPFGCSRRP